MVQKNKRIKVIDIYLSSPFAHDCHAVRRERKRESREELSNPRGRTKWRRERKQKIPEVSRSFMQSHNKENDKYVMISNDKTCARD